MRDNAAEPRIEVFAGPSAAPAEVVIAQTTHGTITALDGATGAPVWRWATRDRRVNVAHGAEHVFVSTATDAHGIWVEVDPPPGWQPPSRSSMHPAARVPRVNAQPSAVTALRAGDGAIAWRVTLYGDTNVPRAHLAGDLLITSILSFERRAKEIIALDATTGALRWRHEIAPLLDASGMSRPVSLWIDDGRNAIIAGAGSYADNDGGYTLLDAATGAFIQRVEQSPRDESYRRTASGGVVYEVDETPAWPHAVIRATSSDGAELWRIPCEGVAGRPPVPSKLLAAGERLYLLSISRRATQLHALDAATGQVVWRWRRPVWLHWLYLLRQPFRRVSEARRAGTWRQLWSDAVHLRWLRPIRPAYGIAMEVAHDRLYLATYLGVFAMRAHDGRPLWHALPLVEVSEVSTAQAGSPSPTASAPPRPATSAMS